MDDFPLSPFLITLSADGLNVGIGDYDRISKVLRTGDSWTVERLRGVLSALLVKDEEQEAAFNQRFDEFFSSQGTNVKRTSQAEIDLFLKSLMQADEEGVGAGSGRPARLRLLRKWVVRTYYDAKRRLAHVVVSTLSYLRTLFNVLLLAALLALVLLPLVSAVQSFIQRQPGTAAVNVQSTEAQPGQPATAPVAAPTLDVSLFDVVIVVAALFLCSVAVGEVLLLIGVGSRPEAPRFDPKKPRLFSPQEVGGRSISYLDQEGLDRAARGFKYLFEEGRSKRLDLDASVEATSRGGGLPTLIYEAPRQLRSVYILEDAYAEPLVWNQSATELAEGLARRGVRVHFGRFLGVPNRFWTPDGEALTLADLDSSAKVSLFLLFSDGKQLNRWRDGDILRAVARWPLAAWMDLRAPLYWDESADLVADYRIPVLPATAPGVQLALETLLLGKPAGPMSVGGGRRGIKAAPPGQTSAYVEWVLGEALPWAQACSMMQPLPLGLADRLRRKFASKLPPERVETLFRLPGSTWDAAGLRFSAEVLAALRAGFSSLRAPEWQEQVLSYIVGQIRAVEPEEYDSLRHLAWEWVLERVRLELDPDAALPNIGRLLLTPLADHIGAEFSRLGPPGETTPSSASLIPLRLLPATREAKRILLRLAPQLSGAAGSRRRGVQRAWGVASFESRLNRAPAAIAERIRRNPALRLEAKLLLDAFELLINFPYQSGQRDSAGYFLSGQKYWQ